MELANYLIIKYKNNYKIYDILEYEFMMPAKYNYKFKITKDNKVYLDSSYEYIDNYYLYKCPETHYVHKKDYIGKLVYSTDNIEDCAVKFVELKGYKYVD